jgi:hypothetical protein
MHSVFSKPLCEATVQEVRLELIRRTLFNAFHGETVANTLLEHRPLWEAVILDRCCFFNGGKLPSGGLIKLRDLSENQWNVDTLFVLTPNARSAQELVRLAEKDGWGGEVFVYDDPEDVDRALGDSDEGRVVVKFWWD